MVMGEMGEDAAEVSLAEKGRSRHCSLVDGELLAQGQVLEAELAVAADDEGEEPKQAAEEGDHKPRGRRSTVWAGGQGSGEGQLLGGRRIASDFDRASSAGRGSSLLLRHQLSFRQTV
jgi:hypothetical protein